MYGSEHGHVNSAAPRANGDSDTARERVGGGNQCDGLLHSIALVAVHAVEFGDQALGSSRKSVGAAPI